MNNEVEKMSRLYLACVKDMWSEKMEKLLKYFGSAINIFEANEKELSDAGMENVDIKYIKDSDDIKRRTDKVISIMRKEKIHFIYNDEDLFPKRFRYMEKPVFHLFYKGNLPDDEERTCGMVGARNCTEYGKNKAMEVAKNLSLSGISIVSGMARGIDAYSHRGAIKSSGITYAVLGCGVDICYPRENIEIYEMITDKGGIISEYIPGTKGLAWHFPHRNRIIAALSDSLAVIEAGKKSGSLITASIALQMGKEIFALPGRVDDRLSMGCNSLISDGAGVLFDGREIAQSMGIDGMISYKKNKKLNIGLEKDYLKVYSCVGLFPKNIHSIIEETAMEVGKVRTILTDLELLNLVREVSKDYFILQGEY